MVGGLPQRSVRANYFGRETTKAFARAHRYDLDVTQRDLAVLANRFGESWIYVRHLILKNDVVKHHARAVARETLKQFHMGAPVKKPGIEGVFALRGFIDEN